MERLKNMKVLVIGSGGREHAIAYKLNQSEKVDKIYAIPGNPGIAKIGECVAGSVEDNEMIVKFAKDHNIDLTVIGPEVPLCNGLADDLEAAGLMAFGPTKYAATLEGSKAFSKDFMIRHNIPTARYKEVNSYDEAVEAINDFQFPLVIKADGLAAGKGVVIVENVDDAKKTLKEMMVDGSLDGAGSKVVLEEFLTGFECSLLCFTDGTTIVPMVSAKDHKQVFDGNTGPNTGGMGTVSPNPFLPEGMDEIFEKEILEPFMAGLKADNMDYRGVVFIGLMIENNKPKVFTSRNIFSGLIFNAAVAIDGSTKCLVFFVLIAVLLLKFGFQASSSSITNNLSKANIYFEKVSLSISVPFIFKSALIVSSEVSEEINLEYDLNNLLALLESLLKVISFKLNKSSLINPS